MGNVISSKTSNIKINPIQVFTGGVSNVLGVKTVNANVEEVDLTNLREEKISFGENSYISSKYDGDVLVIKETVENGIVRDRTEYYEDGKIKSSSVFDENGNLVSFAEYNIFGKVTSLQKYDNGVLSTFQFEYDAVGNLTGGSCNGKAISIFGDYNLNSGQYGGNQMSLTNNAGDLLQDPVVLKMLQETFPDASMEDYLLYLNKITNVGCGYVAQVNTLFKAYEGKESQFYNKFGFSMYTVDGNGNIDFNYEYLVIDYVNSTYGKSGYSIQELYGNSDGTATDAALSGNTGGIMEGVHPSDTKSFTNFLQSEYGITAKGDSSICANYADVGGFSNVILNVGNMFTGGSDFLEHYQKNYGSGDNVIICTEGFDMYTYDAVTGGRGELAGSNVGAHGMTITGVTSSGDFIVSSWGEQFVLGLENIKTNNGSVAFQSIKY